MGAAINAFASENALVVMGTVLDESLGDELRVTVVATGLDQAAVTRADVPVKLVKTGTRGVEVDFRELEKPTVIRNKPIEMRPQAVDSSDPDYLDIPAFLRRQAD